MTIHVVDDAITEECSPACTPKTPADILRNAALILAERGWCQNSIVRPDGRVCAMGAIDLAISGRVRFGPLFEEVLFLLDEHLHQCTPHWNDTPGRTADEVTAAMRATADEWERANV